MVGLKASRSHSRDVHYAVRCILILSPEYSPCGSEKGSLAVENGLVKFHRKQNQQSS